MAAISYHDMIRTLRDLGLNRNSDVYVRAALPALGEVRGGAETIVGALLAGCGTVVMPAFTHATMIWPEKGPAGNGCIYGNHQQDNEHAAMFQPDLPVDADLGPVAEAFQRHPQAQRSGHPVLSFAAAGAHAAEILAAQSIENPLGPLEWLSQHDGDVLLLGANHQANTAIHLAEKLADRKQFVRWAVGADRAYKLPAFPGCSNGFNAIASKLTWVVQQAPLGKTTVQRVPIKSLVQVASQMIHDDPEALLCADPDCLLCNAVRAAWQPT